MLYKAKVKGVRDTVISELQEVENLSLMERSQVENPAIKEQETNQCDMRRWAYVLLNRSKDLQIPRK